MKTKTTPKDTVDALRLLARHRLIEHGDSEDIKASLQGVAAIYLGLKRAGETDLEFPEWYETADLSELMDEDGEDEQTADPTE